MVARGRGAGAYIDACADRVADRQTAGAKHAVMAEHCRLYLQRVLDLENALRTAQLAAVADLTAGFGIERRVVEYHDTQFALVQRIDRRAVAVQRQHPALLVERVVAVEGGRRAVVVKRRGHAELAGGARLVLLAGHRDIEPGGVRGHAALATDVGGQVEREAVGVVQLERGFAIQRGTLGQRAQRRFEDGHAVFDRREEALLLLSQHVHHLLLRRSQIRVGDAHLRDQVRHHAVEECGARAQLVAVADGAADDAAQYIAAAFITRDDAVGDQEGAGADVVGQHLQ